MADGPLSNVLQHIRKLVAAQTAGQQPDRELLQRFLAHRDEAAFTALVERHGPMVLAVCRRRLKHVQDAEDACQATFLVLARKAASIRKHESLASWLHGVAYRVAGKLKNTAARRHAPERLFADVPQADTTTEATWREVQLVLDEELDRLPARYRAPLVLCYLEGKTRDEAAHELGWTEGTLRGRLERGRERLRARLTRRGLSLSAALLATLSTQTAGAGSVPATFIVTTVKTASTLAAGTTAATGIVSMPVAALVEGALQAMFITKLKTAVAIALTVSLLAAGAGVLAFQAPAAKPADPQKVEEPKLPGREEEPLKDRTEAQAHAARLKQLLAARAEAARVELDARMREFQAGRGTLDLTCGASRRFVEAQREMGLTPAELLAVLEAHFQLMKAVHETNEGRYKAGRIAIQDFKQAEFHRLEAEIWLERAKAP